MAKNNKVFITGMTLAVLGIVAYIVGINIGNEHIIRFSTEIGGAGLVLSIASLIK